MANGNGKKKGHKQKSKGLYGVSKVGKRVKSSTSCKTLPDGKRICRHKPKKPKGYKHRGTGDGIIYRILKKKNGDNGDNGDIVPQGYVQKSKNPRFL